MIIVSSHRSHKDSAEYATNQIRAKESWNSLFSGIYYFGPYEPDLDSPPQGLAHTHFINCELWPHFNEIARFASGLDAKYVTFSNADIVLTEAFPDVVVAIENMGLAYATSRRRDLATGAFLENPGGWDIHVVRTDWWGKIADAMPDEYRPGHGHFDTWILMWMRSQAPGKIGDFTNTPCVFHPEHGGRLAPYEIKTLHEEVRHTDIPIHI